MSDNTTITSDLQQKSRRARTQRFDLLHQPVIGRFLRWRWSRIILQVPMFAIAAVMVVHGFMGPQLAPKNLAPLLTWVHYRGLVVLVLLLGGNFFCMACPFLLPRELARKFFHPALRLPRWLRNKGPAVVAFVSVLFLYELFDLWGSPWWTAMLIAGYFASAFLVDVFFEKASFCKYLCPIGQFNFLSSTLSPLEVSILDGSTCTACETKDCIRGQRSPLPLEFSSSAVELPILQRGCELDLFQPRKVGNLDCTFCLDCVYACPHDNIGIITRLPGEELIMQGTRSGIGDLNHRSDWTLLTVAFVFGALLNAFAMVSPVYVVEESISRWTGLTVEWPILGFLFFLGLILEPLILIGGAAWGTRKLTNLDESLWGISKKFTRSLIPLGFGVWLAHYGFHFFTGLFTVIPVSQSAIKDLTGRYTWGKPLWQLGGMPERYVFPLEVGFLGLGLLGALFVGWRIAQDQTPDTPWRGFLPWGIVSLLLCLSAFWILSQPMDMRGTFLGG